MFRVEMLVEDKKLATVLKSVTGAVFNLNVTPVANAGVKQGRVKEVSPESLGGAAILAFIKAAVESGKQTISTAELANAAEQKHKLTYASTMYGVKVALMKGVLSRSHRGIYNINPAKL